MRTVLASRRGVVRLAAVAVVMALLVLDATPVAAGQANPKGSSSGLTYVSEQQLSPRLHELTFTTPALVTPPGFLLGTNPTGETKVRVLLPEGYDAKGKKRYPVLYLYHGGGGDQTTWTTPAKSGDAESYTAGLDVIVVMPDGSIGGGYADWYNAGKFGPPAWETYHVDQLIPWIDSHYRTIADRSHRAMAGLSMGGGGLRYAARRPDLVGVTAAFSGDVDLTQPLSDWHGRGQIVSDMIWGPYAEEEVRWRGQNGPDLAANLRNIDVRLYSGDTGAPEGTYIAPGTVALDERLTQLGIPHEYTRYPGMAHNWTTFNKAFADWLPHMMETFGKPKNTPAKFTFASVEPEYSTYGWAVEVQRPAVEFSALEVTKNERFSVVGSGDATVTTAPVFRAGERYSVKVTPSTGKPKVSTVVADKQVRLRVSVPLGPGNQYQQFIAQADQASATDATGAATNVPFTTRGTGSSFYRTTVEVTSR